MNWWQNSVIGFVVPGAMSFALSFFWAAGHRRRGEKDQRLETLRLLRAEFLYWQASADSDKADDMQRTIASGGTAAAAEVAS